ncbi:MAG: hydrolase [Bacteroidota bacterium]
MKSKIFMYLFFFAALLIVFMYMNQKSIHESQQKSIESLTKELKESKDSLTVLEDHILDLNYFTLQGNDNAMTYLERLGLESTAVERMVSDAIIDKNLQKGGNPLVPLEGMGEMRINKMKFINHRWIQADFSDGSRWGEVIIEYFFDENNELDLTTISSVLYPN